MMRINSRFALISFYLITILTTVKAGTLRHHDNNALLENFELKSSTSSSSSSKGDCEYNGEYYANGQTFKDDCNHCGCAYQQVTCTLLLCRTTVSQ